MTVGHPIGSWVTVKIYTIFYLLNKSFQGVTCHMRPQYIFAQCYLSPDTSELARPTSSQTAYLPWGI